MYHATITNPSTGRKNAVRVFPVATRDAIHLVNEKGVKALSWELLNQTESLDEMGKEMGGETSHSNFALSILENALDWELGQKVVAYIKAFTQKYPGKQPKEIRVAANRSGNVFILSKENQVIFS